MVLYEQPCPCCRERAGWYIKANKSVVVLFDTDGEPDEVKDFNEDFEIANVAFCRTDGCGHVLKPTDKRSETP